MSATSTPARADDSAYCRKVRARARGDAALLIAPSLRLEGVKLPTAFQRAAMVDYFGVAPSSVSADYQVRAGFTLSPLDMYKGLRVVGVGNADCKQHQVATVVAEILAQGKDYGRLPALKKEIAYLDTRRATWESILATGEHRLEANVTTLQQVEELRTRVAVLDRLRAQLAGEVQRLEASGVKMYPGKLSELGNAVEATAMDYERKSSHIRGLDTWDLRFTGGYIPPFFGAQSGDVFGILQLSYSLGGVWRNSSETRYLDARADELKNARYEPSSELVAFRAAMQSAATQATRELEVLESRIAALTAGVDALKASDTVSAAHALALMELERIGAEAERVYLTDLIVQLSES